MFSKPPALKKKNRRLAARKLKLRLWQLFSRQNKGTTVQDDVIVSLTSHPPRYEYLFYTLLSLLRQKDCRFHIMLWIHIDDMDQVPSRIRALQSRNLSIKPTELNIRSFTKIVPSLIEFPDRNIVIADDDMEYPEYWLRDLIDHYQSDKDNIVAYRGHEWDLKENGTIQSYDEWDFNAAPPEPSKRLMPTGVNGVLYPPGSFHEDVCNADLFMDLAPTADDIWLYFMLRLKGKLTRVVPLSKPIRSWPTSKLESLNEINVAGKANDRAMARLIERYGLPDWD